jgi:pyrrolidone-carboxylate peptidase
VTGFGPFLDVKENPSATLAEGTGRPFQILEVAFEAVDEFLAGLDPATFDRLVLLGVANSRTQVTPELFARNQIGHTRDVRGNDRFGPIDPNAPLLLEGTLWGPAPLVELFPNPDLKVSLDAGSYLCNYTYFRALARFPDKRVGFLHVPGAEAMPLDRQAELVQAILENVERG